MKNPYTDSDIIKKASDIFMDDRTKRQIKLKLIFCLLSAFGAMLLIILLVFSLMGKIDLYVYPFKSFDLIFLSIFALDFITGLILSFKKWVYIKNYLIDCLLLIPLFLMAFSVNYFNLALFLQFFCICKFINLFRVVKVAKSIKAYSHKARIFFNTNGFLYVLCSAAVLLITCSFLMSIVEGRSFWDAVWWSIVTCATVGYGDVTPTTNAGRVIGIILMFFGVGLIGMITSTLTTYFTNKKLNESQKSLHKFSDLWSEAKTLDAKQIATLTAVAKILKAGVSVSVDTKNKKEQK